MTTPSTIALDAFVIETIEAELAARGLQLHHLTTGEVEPLRQIGNGLLAELLTDLSALYHLEPTDPSA